MYMKILSQLQKTIASCQPPLLSYQLVPATARLQTQPAPPLLDLCPRQAPWLQLAEGAPASATQEVRGQSEKLAAVHSWPTDFPMHTLFFLLAPFCLLMFRVMTPSHVLGSANELPCLVEHRENWSRESRRPAIRPQRHAHPH